MPQERQTMSLMSSLIQTALDRSKSLNEELLRLETKLFPNDGPKDLINLAIETNGRIKKDLSEMLSGELLLENTPNEEIEIKLRAKTELLRFLHLIMQYVEGAEIQYSPTNMVFPIRRLLMGHIDDFEFILRTSCVYNYSIFNLMDGLKVVFEKTGYLRFLDGFPAQLFITDCPISERRNIPIHCIFAHEIGHVLYRKYNMSDILMPLVSVDEREVQQLKTMAISHRTETQGSGASANEVVPEWIIENAIRSTINKYTWNWIEEITSDAFALCLLGPAYFLAFLYFAGPFASLDSSSAEHPPDRMRIEFMCNMLLKYKVGLKYNAALEEVSGSAKQYVEQWRNYSSRSIQTTFGSDITPFSVAAHAIEPVLNNIMTETKGKMKRRKYTPKRFRRDVPVLLDNLAHGIPPNELTDDWRIGEPRVAESEAILNSGWIYFVSNDDRYAKLLGSPTSKWKTTNRLFGLISKGLEYSELQRHWDRLQTRA